MLDTPQEGDVVLAIEPLTEASPPRVWAAEVPLPVPQRMRLFPQLPGNFPDPEEPHLFQSRA